MKIKEVSEKKIIFFNWLIYFSPIVFFFLQTFFLKTLSHIEIVQIITNAYVLVYFVVLNLIPFVLYGIFFLKIRDFKTNPSDVDAISKKSQLYTKLSMYVPILLNFAFVPIIVMFSKLSFSNVRIIALFLQSVGSLFLFSLTSYTTFLQNYEHYINYIPLKKDFLSMSLKVRSVLISFFAIVGTLFVNVAPLLLQLNFENIQYFFITIIPFSIISTIVGIGCYFKLVDGMSFRIKLINEFAEKIALSDYTTKRLLITSRDEFGVLINSLNIFTKNSIELLGSIQNSSHITQNNAIQLISNMDRTDEAVSNMLTQMNQVNAQINNQTTGVDTTVTEINAIKQIVEDLSSKIDEQSNYVLDASGAIEEMVRNIRSVGDILGKNIINTNKLEEEVEKGRTQVEETAEKAVQIMQDSQSMLEASQMIQNIAEQTNLLALNAAIEASHAGVIL